MAPMKIQPEVFCRETVKPSSSTPEQNHPKIHRFSFIDQISPSTYIPLLFFYNSKNGETDQHNLKMSLSATLSRYYPLAGKIKDNFSLDCNDDGALFLEARIHCNLSEVLNNPDEQLFRLLLPDNLFYKDSILTGPVAVQATYFQCGGMSIGLCLCHKILDMCSMSSFINDWASVARNIDSDININPEFNVGSLYPPLDLPFLTQKQQPPQAMQEGVQRRLVFKGEKIAKLKAMVAGHVPNPTRVEVVSALLHKSANKAAAKASSSGSFKRSTMNLACNLRTKVCPPLSEKNKGNLGWVTPVSIKEEAGVELGYLVEEFQQSKTRIFDSCGNTSNSKELCSMLLKDMESVSELLGADHDIYNCSSWCRFPFYEADFGWGKPIWVTTVCFELKNVFGLMDSREGDGIEAYISMEEEAMAVLEEDEELLSFCSINPSVLNFTH